MPYIHRVPTRIRYYLLDYLDTNKHTVHKEFDYKPLNDMNKNEIQKLFRIATADDLKKHFTN